MDGITLNELALLEPAVELPAAELEAAPASPWGAALRHGLWVLAWGVAQWVGVHAIVKTVGGWEKLPYFTIENVAVWCFLALNATAWLLLGYGLYRFRLPLLWLWWTACASWWVGFYLPYRSAHAAFDAKVGASAEAGAGLARRIEGYRLKRGRLPGRLEDVARRDGRQIPETAFGTAFDYRLLDLRHFELVAPADDGDKTFCYSSKEPKAGFRLSYFRD